MYKCYSDIFGNMPCDNGRICDKCSYMDIEIIKNDDCIEEIWDDDTLNEIDALNEIFDI